MGKTTVIHLKDYYGNIRFSHECEDNSVKKTLEAARSEHKSLYNLFIKGEDLSDIDMSGISLINSFFIDCNLSGAKIDHARLLYNEFRDTILDQAVFTYTDLSYSIFMGCRIHRCIFTGVDMCRVSLVDRVIYTSTFKDIRNFSTAQFYEGLYSSYVDTDQYYPMACPSDGAFIGWKSIQFDDGGKVLIKLEIPEDARRISAINPSRKCRCDKAKVLDIIDLDTGEHLERAVNPGIHNSSSITSPPAGITNLKPDLEYVVGETVYPDSFDENRTHECSHGIHFFINKQDAINYWR